MEKKKISAKLKNINLDRQFFNINTRGSLLDNDNKMIYNEKNNPHYLDRNQFSENILQIEKKDDKINNMRFAEYQTINKDMQNTDRINSFLINKEKKQKNSQFDRLIPNKTKENIIFIPEDTKNKNNLFFKNNKNKKINLDKFNPNIDYSKFLN